MYQSFPLSRPSIFTPYTIVMFLWFLFSISPDTPQNTTQRNVSRVTLFSFTIKRRDMRDKLILLPSFLTYLSTSILLSIQLNIYIYIYIYYIYISNISIHLSFYLSIYISRYSYFISIYLHISTSYQSI